MSNVIQFSKKPYPTEAELFDNPDLMLSCSFCHRPRYEAGTLIGNNAPEEKFICQDCIDKCKRLVRMSEPPKGPGFSHTRAPTNPEAA